MMYTTPSLILKEVEDNVEALFLEQNKKLWYLCNPVATNVSSPPSACHEFKTVILKDVTDDKVSSPCIEILNYIHSGIKDVLQPQSPQLHNGSFWSSFFHSLQFELAGGFLVHPCQLKSESEVCASLILPLLRRIAHSVQQIPTPGGCTRVVFESSFNQIIQVDMI